MASKTFKNLIMSKTRYTVFQILFVYFEKMIMLELSRLVLNHHQISTKPYTQMCAGLSTHSNSLITLCLISSKLSWNTTPTSAVIGDSGSLSSKAGNSTFCRIGLLIFSPFQTILLISRLNWSSQLLLFHWILLLWKGTYSKKWKFWFGN